MTDETKSVPELPAPPPAAIAPVEASPAAALPTSANPHQRLLARARSLERLQGHLNLASALGLVCLVCLVGWNTYAAYARPRAASVPAPRAAPEKVTIYASGGTDLADGERVAMNESEADGFVLVVDSVPEGATVLVDGVPRGETPASMNLECAAGAPVRLEVRKKGLAVVNKSLTCKANRMLNITVRLDARKRR